jgi:hypothetical protein
MGTMTATEKPTKENKECVQLRYRTKYAQVLRALYDNWMPLYQDMYPLWGKTQVMVAKIFWDWGAYWSINTLLFTNNGLTDLELLKKLIGDEIKAQSRKNIAMGKKLAEMLEEAIRNYQSNVITSAQVIQELIDQAKYIRNITSRGEDMGLTDEELAFYDALAQNESAKEVLGNDKLIQLATLIVLRIKDNITIDWDKKENVRSQMRVIVKRLLRKFGYPPDKQAIATETVLEQAKAIIKFEMNR